MQDRILKELGVLGDGVDPSSVEVDLCLDTSFLSLVQEEEVQVAVACSSSSSDEDESKRPREVFFFSLLRLLPLRARVHPARARVPVATTKGGVPAVLGAVFDVVDDDAVVI